MATAPLFVADLATLKAKLRLTGVGAGAAAVDLIDQAILSVRLNFIRRLSKTRVDQIVAMAFTEAPGTADEVTRAVANVTEVEWVRWELMRTLPVMFQDASGDKGDVWNREAPFRHSGQSELERQRNALMETIEANLVLLSGDYEEQEEPSAIQGGDIAAEVTPPRPFQSIFPSGIESLTEAGG